MIPVRYPINQTLEDFRNRIIKSIQLSPIESLVPSYFATTTVVPTTEEPTSTTTAVPTTTSTTTTSTSTTTTSTTTTSTSTSTTTTSTSTSTTTNYPEISTSTDGFTSSEPFTSSAPLIPLSFVTDSPLPALNQWSYNSFGISVVGGSGEYYWYSDFNIPEHLSMEAFIETLTIKEYIIETGTWEFVVQVVDAFFPSLTVTKTFSLTVNAATEPDPLVITETSPLPGGTNGVYYYEELSASLGSGYYDWTVYSGTLPAGITLDTFGTLSGTPTTPGTYVFTLQAADRYITPNSSTKEFSLTIS